MVEEMKENTVELDGDTKEDVGSVSEVVSMEGGE